MYIYKQMYIYLYYYPGPLFITGVHPPLLSFVRAALLDVGVDILGRVNK